MFDSDSDVEILDIQEGLQMQQNTIENLEKELQLAITNNTYQQQEISSLIMQRDDLLHKVQEIEELSNLQEKTLNVQISSLQKNIDELTKDNIKQIEELKLTFDESYNLQKNEFEKILEKQSEQISELVKKVESQEEELSHIQNKLITTELQSCRQQSSITELQSELKMRADTRKCVQQFNEKLMGENINNLNKIDNLSMQVDCLEEKVLKLTQQRDYFKKQFFDSSQKIIQIQQELQQTTNTKMDLKNRNDALQEQCKKIQQAFKENIDEYRKSKQLCQQLQNQIEEQKQKQDIYIKEIGKIKNQLIQQQNYFKEQINQLQITLSNKDQQIQQLSDTSKLNLKRIQQQNSSVLQLKQQELEKRQIIEQKLKKQ